ncbi:MAG: hypothetical protein ACK4EY_16260 [Flavipsychrobacter sp.]
MNANQLAKKLEHARRKMLIYKTEWPRKAGVLALDYIDSNFRAQGYRDKTLVPWRRTQSGKRARFGTKSGILIQSGRLRRDNGMQTGKEQVRIYNRSRYARVHNEGFRGKVTVRAHTRRRQINGSIQYNNMRYGYGANMSIKTRRALKNKRVTDNQYVKSHSRQMNIPQRQFMPNAKRGSFILNTDVRTMTNKDINNILKIVQ